MKAQLTQMGMDVVGTEHQFYENLACGSTPRLEGPVLSNCLCWLDTGDGSQQRKETWRQLRSREQDLELIHSWDSTGWVLCADKMLSINEIPLDNPQEWSWGLRGIPSNALRLAQR